MSSLLVPPPPPKANHPPKKVTKAGDALLKAEYRELVTAIGVVFKHMKTGQFLDCDAIARPHVPSTWNKELVGTMYVQDVAPWWYVSDLEQALDLDAVVG